MYQQVKKLKEIGHTITSIVSQTGLDFKTVKKYLKMSHEEYQIYFAGFKQKVKCFDPYREEIIKIFQGANTSKVQASAIYDHLEEVHGDLPGSERSFRNYMAYLRNNGELQSEPGRIYEPVDPLPPGKQMQLDFGEYRLKDNRKYYIFAAILSHSRCRYVKIYDRPLTTKILIEGLNDCFAYYGGIPKEIVIDQDHLMVVRENKGDILLTNDFKSFRDEMNFDLYVCRKSDPESKGKVENLVNFVKRSFFSTRNFIDLEDARERLSRWLARKANGKKCAPTGRKPAEHLEEERKFLNPLKNSIFAINDKSHREIRKLDKLGQISVRGVKLLLPLECRAKEVSVFISSKEVHVFDIKTDEKIAVYTLKTGISKTHIVRQKSLRTRKYSEMKAQLQSRFHFKEWNLFVDGNFQRYKRYFFDQYNDFQKKFPQPREDLLAKAVKYCLINKTFSMSQLYDTYKYLLQGNTFEPEPLPTEYKLVNNKHYQPVKVAKRKIETYKHLMPSSPVPEVTL
jgi:transposase